jgi:membrane protease YdiL (CAAX protease family)
VKAATQSLTIALAGAGLVALWLVGAPRVVGGWIGEMPAAAGESLFTAVIFLPMLGLGIAGRRWTLARGGIGDVAGWSGTASGLGIGLGAFLLAVGYAKLAGTLMVGAGGAAGPVLLLGIATVVVQVAGEELVFRGWLQPLLMPAIGTPAGIGLVATAFALLHMIGGGVGSLAFVNLWLGGALFGLIAARGDGVVGAFAAHAAWNGAEQLMLGLDPNPGVGAFGSLIDLDLRGAAAWGGSDQGLNASWAMTIALVAVVVPLAIGVWRRPSSIRRA